MAAFLFFRVKVNFRGMYSVRGTDSIVPNSPFPVCHHERSERPARLTQATKLFLVPRRRKTSPYYLFRLIRRFT